MPIFKMVDNGVISDIENTSIYWRQLIIFDYDYEKLKKELYDIEELVEFDLPSELKVTSKLANGEFVPMTDAIYCPWLDKQLYEHFNVGYNKTTNKCCITSFSPGSEKEAEVFIKIANKIPCFYMDGTFGANEMVFLAPKNFKDMVKYEYKLMDYKTKEEYNVGQMKSGRYFISGDGLKKTYLNADPIKFYFQLSEDNRKEWLRKHTTKKLNNETYIIHQTERFIERAKAQSKWIEEEN